MPTISPYTQNLILPNYKTTDYSNDLEMALLVKKQQQYDTFLSRVHSLQNQGLNVSMLNMKGKQRLDAYNQEIDDMLSGELGDLTDEKVQSKVASVFNKISMDSDLKERSRLSSYYQQQMSMIEGMKNSKDPTKSGYDKINETVFRKWDGGLEDFMLADDITGFDQKKQGYVPFKNINQQLVNLTKLLHAESQTVQKPVYNKVKVKQADGSEKEIEVPTGYDILTSDKGVSSERIRRMFEEVLKGDGMAQLEVLSKYRILQNDSPEGRSNLYNSYNLWLKSEHQNTKKELGQVQALKKQYEDTIKGLDLPPDELAVKKAVYQNEIEALTQKEALLNQAYARQLSNQMSQQDWLKMSRSELLPFINQLTTESFVNGVSDALSWKDEVSKVGMDETYFAQLRMNNMSDRLALDAELGKAKLAIDAARLDLDREKHNYKISSEGKPTTTEGLAVGDIFKNESEVFSTWENLENIRGEYNDKTTNIITSKDNKGYQIDPKKLTDTRWLDANQSNHEVQLWNAYPARMGDNAFLDSKRKQPNLPGFEAFKKGVENGDFKNDERLNQIWNAYESDKEVTDWLNDIAEETAEAINRDTGIANVRASSSSPTLGDYAKMNKWDGTGEMKFGVPDGKGGFKQMTWNEVKNEYQEGKERTRAQNAASNIPYSVSGGTTGALTAISNSIDTNASNTTYSGILNNDPNFLETVRLAVDKQKGDSQLIRDITVSKLPQFLQNKHAIFNDPKQISKYRADINAANKMVPGKEDVGDIAIDVDGIAQIAVPVGAGEGAFQIKKDYIKSFEGTPLVDSQGNIVTSPKANVWYKFKPTPINPRDHILNAMFENKGSVTRTIEGKKVVISSERNSPTMYISIDGRGETIPKQDINNVLSIVQQRLAQLKQLEAKPK